MNSAKRQFETGELARIETVDFENFKALERFRISLHNTNVLVGPNNSGKSTVIGALRVLAAGIRVARRQKRVRLEFAPNDIRSGYRIPVESIPISLENAQTDYQDADALATFTLSNRVKIILQFRPGVSDAQMFIETPPNVRRIESAADFRREVPVVVAAIPILGPVEHDEPFVQEETVRRNLGTHRASRNFRSYWHYNPDSFEKFRTTVIQTWPGMDIERPTPNYSARQIHMFCIEDRMLRELYWVGYGFQVWCQILTYLLAEEGSFVVIDEPELYLHPDMQRRLLGLLHDYSSGFLLATHSSEIVAESDPSEIVLIDRRKKASKRLSSSMHHRRALALLGSRQTFALTTIARARVVMFVEDHSDFRLLREVAASIEARRLARADAITPIPLEGHRPEEARAMARAIKAALETNARFAILLDRDFRSDEQIADTQNNLRGFQSVLILERKEIENYLLSATAIARAATKALSDRGTPQNVATEDIEELLRGTAENLRVFTQSRYVETWIDWRLKSGANRVHRTSLHEEAVLAFEAEWRERPLSLVPGKEALSTVRTQIQETHGVTLTTSAITAELEAADVPSDLASFIQRVDMLAAPAPSTT